MPTIATVPATDYDTAQSCVPQPLCLRFLRSSLEGAIHCYNRASDKLGRGEVWSAGISIGTADEWLADVLLYSGDPTPDLLDNVVTICRRDIAQAIRSVNDANPGQLPARRKALRAVCETNARVLQGVLAGLAVTNPAE